METAVGLLGMGEKAVDRWVGGLRTSDSRKSRMAGLRAERSIEYERHGSISQSDWIFRSP